MTTVLRGSDNFDTEGIASSTAKAWVNFDGTGTVAINSAYNVSSITDNGVGDYSINFATSLANGNYTAVGTSNQSGSLGVVRLGSFTKTVSTCDCRLNVSSTSAAVNGAISFLAHSL